MRQGVFQNEKGQWIHWIHLDEGWIPGGHGWVSQAEIGQENCWHKLIDFPTLFAERKKEAKGTI